MSIYDKGLDRLRLLKEIARLKELNREMVEVIKLNCEVCREYQTEACNVFECVCKKVLAKAEGEGESNTHKLSEIEGKIVKGGSSFTVDFDK